MIKINFKFRHAWPILHELLPFANIQFSVLFSSVSYPYVIQLTVLSRSRMVVFSKFVVAYLCCPLLVEFSVGIGFCYRTESDILFFLLNFNIWTGLVIIQIVRVLSRLTYFYMAYCPLPTFSFPDFRVAVEISTWYSAYEFVLTIYRLSFTSNGFDLSN